LHGGEAVPVTATRAFAVALAFTAAAAATAATAAAAEPAARAASPRVAIVPLVDAGEVGARLERPITEAVRSLAPLEVANANPSGRVTAGRAALREPEPTARAQAVGREFNADRALLADAAPLGDDVVVYLRAIDVATGQDLGSSTVTIAATGALDPRARARLRGAVARALDPARNVGHLLLKVDVPGAEVMVDGSPVASGARVDVSVGTHALRVTHPAYHDFLRFVEVEFDQTVALDVALSAFPLEEGQMTVHRQAAAPSMSTAPPGKPKRVWRWWLLGSGIVVAAAAIGVGVWLARPDISADRIIDYKR
jgi:PEGA domain